MLLFILIINNWGLKSFFPKTIHNLLYYDHYFLKTNLNNLNILNTNKSLKLALNIFKMSMFNYINTNLSTEEIIQVFTINILQQNRYFKY